MKVVVVGYGKMLAALILGAQASGHDVCGIFRIDRVKYSKFTLFFKDIFAPSTDYSFIKNLKLYDIKAASVNSKEFINEIEKLGPDAILVGSWSEKFGAGVLNLTKYGVINCHPSLLPKHRGANPYFWAIYSGDDKTGVTFHLMDENLDTGKILMQAAFKIDPDMTGGALRDKASNIARLMVGELLDDIQNKKVIPLAQDEKDASYDKYPCDGIDVLNFSEAAKQNYDKVRGLKPWAQCACVLKINGVDKVFRVKDARVLDEACSCDCAGQTAGAAGIMGDMGARGTAGAIGDIIKADFKNKIFQIKCKEGAIELKVY